MQTKIISIALVSVLASACGLNVAEQKKAEQQSVVVVMADKDEHSSAGDAGADELQEQSETAADAATPVTEAVTEEEPVAETDETTETETETVIEEVVTDEPATEAPATDEAPASDVVEEVVVEPAPTATTSETSEPPVVTEEPVVTTDEPVTEEPVVTDPPVTEEEPVAEPDPLPDNLDVARLSADGKSVQFSTLYIESDCGETVGPIPGISWSEGAIDCDTTESGYFTYAPDAGAEGTYTFTYRDAEDTNVWATYGVSKETLLQMSAEARAFVTCNWWNAAKAEMVDVANYECSLTITVHGDGTITGAGNMANLQ